MKSAYALGNSFLLSLFACCDVDDDDMADDFSTFVAVDFGNGLGGSASEEVSRLACVAEDFFLEVRDSSKEERRDGRGDLRSLDFLSFAE